MTNLIPGQISSTSSVLSPVLSNTTALNPLAMHLSNRQTLVSNLEIPSILEVIRNSTILLNLLFTVLSITFFWLARYIVLHLVSKYKEDPNILYRWRKASSTVTLILNIIIISQIWIKEFNNLLTYLGLLSAGIAIALKDFIVNALGWLYIVSSKPFIVGDRIQIGELSGDVIDIKAFFFTIMEIGNWVHADQSTGRIVHVPNGQLFTANLSNYTKAFKYIWNEIPVTITFDSDWKKAKEILTDILEDKVGHMSRTAEKKVRDAAKKFMIYYSTLAPAIYTETEANGIILTLRYLCEVKQRRNTKHLLWEAILEEFGKYKNINFAYNTLTVHKGEDSPAPKTVKTPRKA